MNFTYIKKMKELYQKQIVDYINKNKIENNHDQREKYNTKNNKNINIKDIIDHISELKLDEEKDEYGCDDFIYDCLIIIKNGRKKKKLLLNYKIQDDILKYYKKNCLLILHNYWNDHLDEEIKNSYNNKYNNKSKCKKMYRWISYYKEGPPGFCNNETDFSQLFNTKEEAMEDAEINSRKKFDNSFYPRIFKGYEIEEIVV